MGASYSIFQPTDYIMENGKKKRVDENTRAKVMKIRIMFNNKGLQLSSKKDAIPKFIFLTVFFETASPVACLMKNKNGQPF